MVKIGEIKVGSRVRQDMGDIAALARSIEELGLLQPIGIDSENTLIFGHRRLQAFQLLGRDSIPARVISIPSLLAGEHAENEMRKDFTLSERVAIGKALEADLGERRGRPASSDNVQDFAHLDGKKTREVAAERAGFGNPETYRQAKKVVDEGAPELVQAVESGRVSVSVAATVAEAPKEQQREIVAKGEREILEAAKAIRAQRSEDRRAERVQKIVEISKGNAPLDQIAERYPVIYADPPWRYEYSETESRAIENQYPTMSLEEIKALPLDEICTDDCVLFMWATSPKLADAFAVLQAWGFSYRTCAVWDKQKIGMGYYFRQQHELLLVATRGAPPAPLPAHRPPSVFAYPRGAHSAKPHEVYEIIEAMYSDLPKLEMFCRTPREGWGSWGNQAKAA